MLLAGVAACATDGTRDMRDITLTTGEVTIAARIAEATKQAEVRYDCRDRWTGKKGLD